jgi:hypothetical protein
MYDQTVATCQRWGALCFIDLGALLPPVSPDRRPHMPRDSAYAAPCATVRLEQAGVDSVHPGVCVRQIATMGCLGCCVLFPCGVFSLFWWIKGNFDVWGTYPRLDISPTESILTFEGCDADLLAGVSSSFARTREPERAAALRRGNAANVHAPTRERCTACPRRAGTTHLLRLVRAHYVHAPLLWVHVRGRPRQGRRGGRRGAARAAAGQVCSAVDGVVAPR